MQPDRFARLAALRGDVVNGIPVSAWAANLDDIDRDVLLRALIEAIRTLLLPEWESKRPDDRRPQAALAATEAWLAARTEDNVASVKAAAKDCTAARNDTFGKDHHVADAARGVAWAVTAKDNTPIWEALQHVEQELLARVTLVAEYHRLPEQRRAILKVLQRVLEPPQETATPVPTGPVPYSASGNFAVGQALTHVKFGDLVVTAAGDKWIDVRLTDGSTKRLAQKPK
ncbi:MAG TPA: hypothetical protein VK932_13205 [Kofleriaceae bacterium]|nr:hypothetical protein [Kofleriaceae bacterium]